MPLVSAVAGRFSSTYTPPAGSPTDLGIMKPPGYTVSASPAWHVIDGSDAYAESAIEAVFRGWKNVFVDCESLEYKAGPLLAINPFATFAPTGAQNFGAGVVGRLATALAGSLILTAATGTPAAATPATMTASLAAIREGFDAKWMMDSDIRTVPIGFRLFAVTDAAAGTKYYSCT